jgi:S-adenosylmethionine uptake transporter
LSARIDGRLIGTVLVGFAGVALVLRPTLDQNQLWAGLVGLLSGMLSALAYLQVTALGRVGEPEYRVVFYFSLGGIAAGLLSSLWTGFHAHTWKGAALLLATGVLATTAQILMTRAYAIGRTLSNASLQYLGIVFSFLYGVVLFDDPVTWMALAGMLLIVGAGLAATLLRSRSAAPDSTFSAADS